MNLLPFLAVATSGAVLATLLRGRRRAGTLVGFAGVAAALVALVLTAPGETLSLGGGAVSLTAYARVLLGVGLAGGLLVLTVSRLATWEAPAPATLLVAVAGLTVALGVGGAIPGLLAIGATSALAAAVALAHPATPLRVRALAREARGATLAMTIGLVAVSLAPEAIGGLAVHPQVAGLAAVAAGLALGHRFGAIPLHARVARLSDAAPASVLPALLALIPAGWAVVLLGWAPDTLGPAAPVLGWDGTLLVIVGLATLVLGTLAALLQDDLLRIVAYTVVLDAGVVLLGFSSLDPAGRDALRAWLVPFVASRAGLVGWVIAFRAAFGTTRLSEARGWLRRAPALGVGARRDRGRHRGLARRAGLGCPAGRARGRHGRSRPPRGDLRRVRDGGRRGARPGHGPRPPRAPGRRRSRRAGARAGGAARRGPGAAARPGGDASRPCERPRTRPGRCSR